MLETIAALIILFISIAFLLDPQQYHPGPTALPILGNVIQLYDFIQGNIHSRCLEYSRKYGGIVQLTKPMLLSHRHMFIISDPEVAKVILRTKAETFKNRPPKSLTEFVAPKGLLSLKTDSTWWTHRSILNPMLTFDEYLQAYIPSVCGLTTKMIERMMPNKEKATVNIYDKMTRLAFDIICDIGFDYDSERADEDGSFLKNARAASAKAVEAAIASSSKRKAMQAETIQLLQGLYDVINAQFKKLPLEKRNDPLPEEMKELVEKPNISLALIRGKDENGMQLGEKEIIDEMVTLLLAGHETTANTLSWGVYLLAKHKKVQDKAYNEVRKFFPQSDISKNLNLEILEKCEYLHLIMNETLRLYTTVPSFARHSEEAQTIGQYEFPADSVYMISPYAMCHSKELWGDDVDEFKPERFLTHHDPYMFLPWGGGKRICAGSHVAKLEFKIIIGLLLLYCEISFEEDFSEPIPEGFATLGPKDGIKVLVKPRIP